MRKLIILLTICFIVILFATNIGFAEKPKATENTIAAGKKIYDQVCFFCHGSTGKGDGPAAFPMAAYLAPRPRDFTNAVHKFRSTPTGTLPTDEDLFRTLTNGIPGFMPSFMGLTESERWQVIYYIKSFSSIFEEEQVPPPITFGEPIKATAASIERGREVYMELKCWDCHGVEGKGDGPSAGNMFDDWRMKMTTQDLRKPFTFRGGENAEDIYRTFMTGLNGSPMPSYATFLKGREEDAWHMVNYILSLSRPTRPTH
ncbi:MAG: c-type cytochrome [bacterium]